MQGYDRQFVVQGIHMLFNGELGPLWPAGSARRSKLVFIGVRLPHKDLSRGFESCIIKSSDGANGVNEKSKED